MMNAAFYDNIRRILREEKGDMSVFELQKMCKGTIPSTFFSMFQKKSSPRLDYIVSISKALNKSPGELIDPDSSVKYLNPLQIEIMKLTDDMSEDQLNRAITTLKVLKQMEENDE